MQHLASGKTTASSGSELLLNRARAGQTFTRAFPQTIISLNPGKPVGTFSAETIAQWRQLLINATSIQDATSIIDKRAPHGLEFSARALLGVMQGKSSMVNHTGETGAGKSILTSQAGDFCLDVFPVIPSIAVTAAADRDRDRAAATTTRNTNTNTNTLAGVDTCTADLKAELTHAMELLGLLGNAKTKGNEDSSRFGKQTTIEYAQLANIRHGHGAQNEDKGRLSVPCHIRLDIFGWDHCRVGHVSEDEGTFHLVQAQAQALSTCRGDGHEEHHGEEDNGVGVAVLAKAAMLLGRYLDADEVREVMMITKCVATIWSASHQKGPAQAQQGDVDVDMPAASCLYKMMVDIVIGKINKRLSDLCKAVISTLNNEGYTPIPIPSPNPVHGSDSAEGNLQGPTISLVDTAGFETVPTMGAFQLYLNIIAEMLHADLQDRQACSGDKSAATIVKFRALLHGLGALSTRREDKAFRAKAIAAINGACRRQSAAHESSLKAKDKDKNVEDQGEGDDYVLSADKTTLHIKHFAGPATYNLDAILSQDLLIAAPSEAHPFYGLSIAQIKELLVQVHAAGDGDDHARAHFWKSKGVLSCNALASASLQQDLKRLRSHVTHIASSGGTIFDIFCIRPYDSAAQKGQYNLTAVMNQFDHSGLVRIANLFKMSQGEQGEHSNGPQVRDGRAIPIPIPSTPKPRPHSKSPYGTSPLVIANPNPLSLTPIRNEPTVGRVDLSLSLLDHTLALASASAGDHQTVDLAMMAKQLVDTQRELVRVQGVETELSKAQREHQLEVARLKGELGQQKAQFKRDKEQLQLDLSSSTQTLASLRLEHAESKVVWESERASLQQHQQDASTQVQRITAQLEESRGQYKRCDELLEQARRDLGTEKARLDEMTKNRSDMRTALIQQEIRQFASFLELVQRREYDPVKLGGSSSSTTPSSTDPLEIIHRDLAYHADNLIETLRSKTYLWRHYPESFNNLETIVLGILSNPTKGNLCLQSIPLLQIIFLVRKGGQSQSPWDGLSGFETMLSPTDSAEALFDRWASMGRVALVERMPQEVKNELWRRHAHIHAGAAAGATGEADATVTRLLETDTTVLILRLGRILDAGQLLHDPIDAGLRDAIVLTIKVCRASEPANSGVVYTDTLLRHVITTLEERCEYTKRGRWFEGIFPV